MNDKTDLAERLKQIASDINEDPATAHWMTLTLEEAIEALETTLANEPSHWEVIKLIERIAELEDNAAADQHNLQKFIEQIESLEAQNREYHKLWQDYIRWDDGMAASYAGHAAMCVRMKLRKDEKQQQTPKAQARIERGQNTLQWLKRHTKAEKTNGNISRNDT